MPATAAQSSRRALLAAGIRSKMNLGNTAFSQPDNNSVVPGTQLPVRNLPTSVKPVIARIPR